MAEQARLEHGVRFDNSFVAGFARRLEMEYPEMVGLLRTKRTRIPWESIVDDLPNVDLGRPGKGGKMGKRQAEALVQAMEKALEARKVMQERRKMMVAYGFGEEALQTDIAYNRAMKSYEEAVRQLAEILGGGQ